LKDKSLFDKVNNSLDETLVFIPMAFFYSFFVPIIILVLCIYRTDYTESLTKSKVQSAVIKSYPGIKIIKRISFRQGGDAGEFGYYFVEFDPVGYAIVPNDARLYQLSEFNLKEKISFVDYYKSRRSPGITGYNRVPSFNRTLRLQFNSFMNNILGHKNESQLFFEKIGSSETYLRNR
jgi:hypothetical protein